MKYILTFLFAFCIMFYSQAQAKKSIDLKKLNGIWISTEDKKYSVFIMRSIMQEYYDKKQTAVHNFKVYKNVLTAKDIKTNDVLNMNLQQ